MSKRKNQRQRSQTFDVKNRQSRIANRDPYAAKLMDAAKLIEAECYDAAIDLLNPIVEADQKHAEAVHFLGLAMVRQGYTQRGLAYMSRSVGISPDAVWMRVNRAAIRQSQGEHEKAIEDLEAAVRLDPKASAAWTNLTASCSIIGDLERAHEAAAIAVELAPNSANALHAYGNTLVRRSKFAEAEEMYRRAIKINPGMLNARVSRLQTLLKLERSEDAQVEMDAIAGQMGGRIDRSSSDMESEEHIGQAMAGAVRDAVNTDAMLAMALDAIGLHEQAIEAAERATVSTPDDPYGWSALGVGLFRLRRFAEAIAPLERAIEIRPKWAEIRGTLGNVLMAEGRHPEAIIALNQALEDAPKMASLWASLGAAKREIRMLEASEAAFAEADRLAPENSKYGLSLALTQIRQKKLDIGWPNYDRRWKTAAFLDQTRPHKHPVWDGSDLTGKKILVYAEQGVGDEIMFGSYLQKLIDQGAAVFLEVTNRLAALFQRSFPGVQVGISQNPPISAFGASDFDWQIPAGALMSHFTPSYDRFRPNGAYLKADPVLVNTLRARYLETADGDNPPLIVGISWRSGNPTGGKLRSAELAKWAPIISTPGVRFVNLQYGDCSEEIAAARVAFNCDIIEDDAITSDGMLDMFAAQVRAMDLVVSIDNSTIHFAGALGVPTFMMLNYEPDWRWFGGDEGNPWYESVAHVRQQAFNEWEPVIEAAAEVVAAAAQTGALPAATDPLRPAMVNHGAKPKALLANDTTAWYHWGCTATSLAIRDQIRQKGYDLAATPIRSIYMARPAPSTLQEFDDPEFFDVFTAANPHLMRQAVDADVIIVNGEGTLHGLTDNVRGLLYFAYAAAQRLGKRVQIINHSCYPEDAATLTDPIANGLYKRVYEKLEYAAFREHISFGLMRQIGIQGALAFDSLPLTAKKMAHALPAKREKRIVIAGSASADDRTAAAFAEYARWAAAAGWQISVLTGARAFPSNDEAVFTRALTRFGLPAGTDLIQAGSLQEWMAEIARAGMVTTGRFHHSIAAFSTGAPFVAASSNTAKTNAIMQLLERPEPLPIRAPDLAARLIEAHQAALDNQEQPNDHAVRLEAVETLALENYTAL